jgi:hypothetical protein
MSDGRGTARSSIPSSTGSTGMSQRGGAISESEGSNLMALSTNFDRSINLGALISYTLVAPICQYGLKGLGKKESLGAPHRFP